ncbi:MAG: hypothetical protein RsTaC01_0268 [Candidatus Paraimprobicoccus trichonymphae]|uniref:Peptidase C39-like domain-containing protein n=1 Tax=Candidatus Paraimprobicoccus trichonymphae TaxID=3033793 RepID=A0AA48HW35_9FIRM|nr:MAG: hypothetical protein RsTaC01_0268 [Candidatus Paraimprobicoccus trichonymphae]
MKVNFKKFFLVVSCMMIQSSFFSNKESNSLETNSSNPRIISIPYNTNQDGIVFGCEAVSATMVLRFYGYYIDEFDFTDNYLIQRDFSYSDDSRICEGSDPNYAYPGNSYKDTGLNQGFGIFGSGLTASLNKFFDKNEKLHIAKNTTGMSLKDLITNYIDKGKPVIFWATMGMKKSSEGKSWIINFTDENSPYKEGDEYTWYRCEHCLVLVGYDEEYYYFNDSLNEDILTKYEKKLVEQRFLEMGKNSVVVLPVKSES